MNCYFDRIAEEYGDEYVQRVYEEIRRDPQAYRIKEDTSGVDLVGIPILFTVMLKSALNAENKVRERMRAETLLPLLIQIEPEPLSTIGLDVFITTVNEKAPREDVLTVIKVKAAKLRSCSQELASDTAMHSMIVYKSRIGKYYNFVRIIRAIDGEYVYGPKNRQVPLSYCIDESDRLILITPKRIKRRHFSSENELSEKDIRSIEMAYKYKPIEDTLKRAYENMEW